MSYGFALNGQRRRVGLWNSNPIFANTSIAGIESEIKKLAFSDCIRIKDLADLQKLSCDVLIVIAIGIESGHFIKWVEPFLTKIKENVGVLVPVLIFAELESHDLRLVAEWGAKENHYFDVISPDHLDSIPIRVANLFRINDHIHEISRMQIELDSLQSRIDLIEAEIKRQS